MKANTLWRKTKRMPMILALGGMPLAITGSCDLGSGAFDFYRTNDAYYYGGYDVIVDEYIYDGYYYDGYYYDGCGYGCYDEYYYEEEVIIYP